MKKTIDDFMSFKKNNIKISMLTAYDYQTAKIMDSHNIDCILVGDSLGTNLLGYKSEKEVTMDDMIHHLKAVKRGTENAYIIGDMPYMSYETPDKALLNAKRFIENGADAVKLEGFQEKIISYLIKNEIEVIGHTGLNPQFHSEKRIIGKSIHEAEKLIIDAIRLQKAGIKMLILELVPEEIAGIISKKLKIPTIGIGAGRYCDGQVLVINDLVGLSEKVYRHVNPLANIRKDIEKSIGGYIKMIKNNTYINENNVSHIKREVLEELISDNL
jgi:3-methyl-2-oxobutanoate hydroxymethyltransferase